MLLIAVCLTGCGDTDYDSLARKVEANQDLSASDYDDMIAYMSMSTEWCLPHLREARTIEDVERIDEQLLDKYPYTDIFSSALLRNWNKLSPSQTTTFRQISQRCKEAYK